MRMFLITFSTLILACLAALTSATGGCSKVKPLGILQLPFRAAYLAAKEFDGEESLFISSFLNIALNPIPPPPTIFEERDLVAQVFNLEDIEEDEFPFADPLIQVLTDLDPSQTAETVWPNALVKAPEGVFPFENAIVSAQGFFTPAALLPGRLVAIDVDTFTEYVISQSSQLSGGFNISNKLDPDNSPRFYHTAVFHDMDGDGYKDIITVRSGFRIVPFRPPYPPFSELVWFQNPGLNLNPNDEWVETILYGGPFVGFQGPDIDILLHDFDGDGVPEFVTTHFFAGNADTGKITLYGAPARGTWSQVNALNPAAPKVRTKDLVVDQGKPFSLELVDLNGDHRIDILGTNHQPDGSAKFPSQIPGRVFAVEQPTSGDVFVQNWTTRVLLDNIRPNPSLPPFISSRLAPGFATAFYPYRGSAAKKPWILVGGDEASKVWVLNPKNQNRHNWVYESKVIFDINEFYGPNTTQSSPQGIGYSTIGKTIVIPSKKKRGDVIIFVPVFEASEIHVFRLKNNCGG